MARSRYDRGFSGWRGVDFTSDPSNVSDHRFADALNMWRDYRSQNGAAVETFPGYRRLPCLPEGATGKVHNIYGLHGNFSAFVLFHVGTTFWFIREEDIDTQTAQKIEVLPSNFSPTIPNCAMQGVLFQNHLYLLGGGFFLEIYAYGDSKENEGLHFRSGSEDLYSYIPTAYVNGILYEQQNMLSNQCCEKWTEFAVNDLTIEADKVKGFYLTLQTKCSFGNITIDGMKETNYTLTDGKTVFRWYQDDDDTKDLLTTITIVADLNDSGKTIVRQLTVVEEKEGYFDAVEEIIWHGTLLDPSYKIPGRFSFSEVFPTYDPKKAICNCTVLNVYDGRLFFTGNPNLPNTTFYCGRNAETGLIDPTYVGYLNYFTDGVGHAVNRGLLSIGGYLCIFKEQSGNAASVYYRSGADTEDDILPRIYVQTEGPLGIGCYGECCNFADDAVFISDRGLDALGKLATNAERSVFHRSTNVDNRLLREDLRNAKLEEWEGYLVLLCPSGNIYLADSRALYEKGGSFEYEWFFLSRFGHQNGDPAYRYSAEYPSEYRMLGDAVLGITVTIGSQDYPVWIKCTDEALCENPEVHSEVTLCWKTVSLEGAVVSASLEGAVVSLEGDVAYLLFQNEEERWPKVNQNGVWEEGTFSPACAIANVGGKLFFGTGDGCLYIVNTDQRTVEGIIPRKYYTFDNIAITAGAITKMDDCGAPHVFKRTVPRSCVIDMKSMPGSVFSCAVRTEAHDWQDISTASGAQLDFEDLDFNALAFMARDVGKYVLKDRTKRWSQKQYQVYSTAYRRPFGLCRLYYTYEITGRLKAR